MDDQKLKTENPSEENDLGNELEKSQPQVVDEQDFSGSMTDPELVQEETTLEAAQDVGLYNESDEEHPQEVGIAGEINKDEKKLWEE